MNLSEGINENVAQINNFNRRAEQLAKIVNMNGAIIIAMNKSDDESTGLVSIGCYGLNMTDMLYALGCAIHHTFVFEQQENHGEPPSSALRLTPEQKALIIMRLTYNHFANKDGSWVDAKELEKVLDELEF